MLGEYVSRAALGNGQGGPGCDDMSSSGSLTARWAAVGYGSWEVVGVGRQAWAGYDVAAGCWVR